jgi:hypothetical protein
MQTITSITELEALIASSGGIIDANVNLANNTEITTLPAGLIEIKGSLDVTRCPSLKSFGTLKRVGINLKCWGCPELEDFGELTSVGWGLDCSGNTSLKSFGALQKTGNYINCRDCTSLKDFGLLETVGGDFHCRNCVSLQTFGCLKKVNGNIDSAGCPSLARDLSNYPAIAPGVIMSRDSEGKIHCEDGPASVSAYRGLEYWWHGVYVTEQVVLAPQTLTIADIESAANDTVRNVMLQRWWQARHQAA